MVKLDLSITKFIVAAERKLKEGPDIKHICLIRK